MPHEPTRACDTKHCHHHNEDEPSQPGDYLYCGECSHVYRTPEELVDAYVEVHAAISPDDYYPAPKPEKIFHCPYCAHDF